MYVFRALSVPNQGVMCTFSVKIGVRFQGDTCTHSGIVCVRFQGVYSILYPYVYVYRRYLLANRKRHQIAVNNRFLALCVRFQGE